MESRGQRRRGPRVQFVQSKPALATESWWLSSDGHIDAAKRQAAQARMSGTTTTYAKPSGKD